FVFASRRRHTRSKRDWSSDVCSSDLPEQDLQNHINEIPKDKEIIVYCWDVWCNTASKVAASLLEKGYRVRELSGGIAAWQQMNFPVTDFIQKNNVPNDCEC